MWKSLFILLFSTTYALAQVPGRPTGNENIPAPIILPEAGIPRETPQTPTGPVGPTRAIPFGGFKPLTIEPPPIERLFTMKTIDVRAGRETIPTTFLTYTPGGSTKLSGAPIVVTVPPGQDLFETAQTTMLHPEARLMNRPLLIVGIQPTNVTPSAPVQERNQQARDARDDGQRTGLLIDGLLRQESYFAAPSIIGMDGTGTLWQDFLCQGRNSTQIPAGLFLWESALRSDKVASCNPTRIPNLVLFQTLESTTVPFNGGQPVTGPGQAPQGTIVSAPATRSFWALIGKCATTPTLTWLPLERGRLAKETHGSCRNGGPVNMLTLVEGSLRDEQRSVLMRTFLNGALLGQ